jgi:glycosyltransferase involved in cell wall biosynthesis
MAGKCENKGALPGLLILASTYPRFATDHEPGFVHEMALRLARSFDVIVLCPHAQGARTSEVMDGVQVIRYRYAPSRFESLVHHGGITTNLRRHPWKWLLTPGFIIGQYLAAARLLREKKIAVIHAHWLIPQGLIARRLQQRFNVPYLVTSHGGDLFGLRGKFLRMLKQKVAQSCSAMTVVSSAMQTEAIQQGLRPPGLEVLPMGVDVQGRFTPNAHIARNAHEILFVGRLVEKKGLKYLIEAMSMVLKRCPEVFLTIAGFGPEEQALTAQVKQLGLAGHVRFMGAQKQEDLPALYQRAALFVAPFVRAENGDQEGLPVALMEAIACGCPVIAGKVAGVHDLLGADGDDVCVDPKDIPALASMIIDMLENPVWAREKALAIRDAAAFYVSWERVAGEYKRLLWNIGVSD